MVTALFHKPVYLKTSCLCNHTQMPCFWIHENERAGVISSYTIWAESMQSDSSFNASQDIGYVAVRSQTFFSVTIIIANAHCDELHLHKYLERFSLFLPFLFIADGQIHTELNIKIMTQTSKIIGLLSTWSSLLLEILSTFQQIACWKVFKCHTANSIAFFIFFVAGKDLIYL